VSKHVQVVEGVVQKDTTERTEKIKETVRRKDAPSEEAA
jgi:hypothetical protein